MDKSTRTTVIEKLIDLELLFKIKADLSRFKKRQQEYTKAQQSKAA